MNLHARLGNAFLKAHPLEAARVLEEVDGVHPSRALEIYCLMVLNLNEFVYLD